MRDGGQLRMFSGEMDPMAPAMVTGGSIAVGSTVSHEDRWFLS